MNINEIFYLYPEFEPSYNGINYLTLIDVNGDILYGMTYFNKQGEFEPKYGNVVAFTEIDPKIILNLLHKNNQ